MMRNKYQLSILLIFICILVLSCSSLEDKNISQKKSDYQKQKLQQKINDVRSNLISRYDPIVFPPKDFEKIKVFTCKLQKILINENKRYILFEGFIDDITKEKNGFLIHFTSRLSNDFLDDRTVKFHLKSKYEDIKFLIENPPERDFISQFFPLWGRDKDFFVVCQTTELKKIVNYSVQGHSSEGSEDVELEIQFPDTFSASGELIEMVKYP